MGFNVFRFDPKAKALRVEDYVPDDDEVDRETARRILGAIGLAIEIAALRKAVRALAAGQPPPQEFEDHNQVVDRIKDRARAKKEEAAQKRSKRIIFEEWWLKKKTKVQLEKIAQELDMGFLLGKPKARIVEGILKAYHGDDMSEFLQG